MSDEERNKLEERICSLEKRVRVLEARAGLPSKQGENWVEQLSGSMSDFPEDLYDEIMKRGRELVSGEVTD